MKNLIKGSVIAFLMTTGAAYAMPCDGVDLALEEAVHEVLTGAEDPRISGLAGYLNQSFYRDMSCRLSQNMTAADVLRLRDNPGVLLYEAQAMSMDRNQPDALTVILSAMQSTEES